MLVSSVTLTDSKTVFNTRIKDNKALNNSTPESTSPDKQAKLFDSINEWKYFCHRQIEKGIFDIIA